MKNEPAPQSEMILYQTEDGRTRVQCRFEDKTLWLTQAQIAELFESIRLGNPYMTVVKEEAGWFDGKYESGWAAAV